MRIKTFLVLLVCLFGVVPLSVLAQTTVEENDVVGIRIEYPEDWVSDVVQVSEGVNTLYLVDSDDTLEQITSSATAPMPAGTFSMVIYSPSFVAQITTDIDELLTLFEVDADDWEELTINGELAYQWQYEDERTTGFLLAYTLPDGRLNFSVVDTAVGEMTDKMINTFIEVIESIETYSSVDDIDEDFELTETAVSESLSFAFQYPNGWELSDVEDVPTGVVISPNKSSDSLTDFLGGLWLLVLDIPAEMLGLDEAITDELDEMNLGILEAYAESAEAQGVNFTEVDMLDIDGIPVGRVSGQGTNTIYMFVLEGNIVQIWVGGEDDASLEILETATQAIIPTITTDIPEIEAPTYDEYILSPEDLDATYVMENDVVFDYPSDWTVLEENGLVFISNLDEVEDFTAQSGEFLLIVSAVPVEERDVAQTIASVQGVIGILIANPEFNVDVFRIDGSDIPTDLTFDVGDGGVDWDFTGGLLSSADESVNGAIFIIMNIDDYDPELATAIIDPLLFTFRIDD